MTTAIESPVKLFAVTHEPEAKKPYVVRTSEHEYRYSRKSSADKMIIVLNTAGFKLDTTGATRPAPLTPPAIPAEGKHVVRNEETRDFSMYLDGQLVGCARTETEADVTLDQLVDEIARHTRATTADMAAETAAETIGTCEGCHVAPATHQVGGRSAAALWLCDACGEITSYDDDATPEQIAQRDAENEAAMLEWLHESDATAPQAPTRTVSELQDELNAITDAIHDRKAVGAGYARLHQQRSRIIAELDAAHTVEDAALRQRLWEIITPDAPPYVSLGDDPEGATRPPRCDGYQGNDCLNRAVITREVNLSTNPADPYDVRTFHLCDLCSDAWSAWLPTKPCLACGGAHHIQRCTAVHAPRPSLALWGPPNPLCLKCQQAHDPILDCPNPVAVPSEPEHDPCAGVRAALEQSVVAMEGALVILSMVRPSTAIEISQLQVALQLTRARLG